MATLPVGTVTFLFTDIEGSTQLLRHLGDGYRGVVAQHRRVLREVASEHGGTEIDAQGDAFFFTFTRARDALAAAIAGQRRLLAQTWPRDAEPKVRMGLHTGEPALGEEGYVGIDVVRGARVAGAAHGGQILISDATRALLPAELPDEARIVDLGEHTLKDMDRPERLFQIEAPGLATAFSTPRAEKMPGAHDFGERIDRYVKKQLDEAFRSIDLEESDRRSRRWRRLLGGDR